MRTLGFSIALKRAQDHRIRSPYAQVMHVSVSCSGLSLGTSCARGFACTVGTGSQPPWARGAQEVSVGAATASFGGWL